MRIKIALTFIILFLASCENGPQEFQSLEELKRFVLDENNGLSVTKSTGNHSLKLIYKPTDEVVHQLIPDKSFAAPAVDSLRNYYGRFLYFNVYLSKNNTNLTKNAATMEEHSRLIHELSFNLGKYVYLTTAEKDTVPLKDHFTPRLYGMGSESQFLLVFDKPDLASTEYLKIHFTGFFSEDIRIETKNLANEPRITAGKNKI